jgi:hypothetical protein
LRIKHQDYSNLLFLADNPEAEAMEPDGIETVRNQSVNLDKQYSDIGAGIGVREGQSVSPAAQGGQAINPKPDEERTTIGDGNLGAGTNPVYETYPYPPNPNLDGNLGIERGPYTQPKLQVQGPPQDSYGVRNTFSNTGNYGNPADQALTQVTERVAEAVRREVANELMTTHDEPDLGGPSSRIPIPKIGAPLRQDGNEALNPDGTLVANGPAGDGVRQIPNIAKQMKSEELGDDYHFPYIIAFDYNGTIDARGTGRGIPIQVLQDLQRRGKKVLVFTSSTQGADKDFMRQTLDQLSIPYTDDERVLTDVDMLIGDKKSDEKRAGRYGVKFIDVTEFSMDKVLAKSVSIPGMNRTVIGDSWDGNVNDYREGGVPIIMNSPSQRDILLQLLRARGFVDNEMNPTSQGQVGGRLRLEHKMGGAIATVEGSQDNQRLEVSITDRTGAPELVTDDWSKLYGYLGEKFPREDN